MAYKEPKKMVVESPLYVLAKWSVPFGMATTIIGGSAWLTSTHNTVEQSQVELRQLKSDFREMNKEASNFSERLGRIEEKLDFIVKIMEHRRRNESDVK